MAITSVLYNECLRRRCLTKKGNVAQVEFYNRSWFLIFHFLHRPIGGIGRSRGGTSCVDWASLGLTKYTLDVRYSVYLTAIISIFPLRRGKLFFTDLADVSFVNGSTRLSALNVMTRQYTNGSIFVVPRIIRIKKPKRLFLFIPL